MLQDPLPEILGQLLLNHEQDEVISEDGPLPQAACPQGIPVDNPARKTINFLRLPQVVRGFNGRYQPVHRFHNIKS